MMMGHKTINVTQMYAHIKVKGNDIRRGLKYVTLIDK